MADLIFGAADPVLRRASFAAYNDFVAEYCGQYPTRLAGIAAIDLDDPIGASAEVERCSRLDLRGIVIRGDPPAHLGYDRPELDRFWATVIDAGLPVSIHRSAVRRDVSVDVMGALLDYTLIPQQAQRLLTSMLLSGVWE